MGYLVSKLKADVNVMQFGSNVVDFMEEDEFGWQKADSQLKKLSEFAYTGLCVCVCCGTKP